MQGVGRVETAFAWKGTKEARKLGSNSLYQSAKEVLIIVLSKLLWRKSIGEAHNFTKFIKNIGNLLVQHFVSNGS